MRRIPWPRAAGAVIVAAALLTHPVGCGKKEEPAGPPADAGAGGKAKPAADPLAEAKERSKANLSAIAEACHNYANALMYLPVGLLDPKTKRPGLSWRVQILPYLGDPTAAALYQEFKLDEP